MNKKPLSVATFNVTMSYPGLNETERVRIAARIRTAIHHAVVTAACAQVKDGEFRGGEFQEGEFLRSQHLTVDVRLDLSSEREA